MKQVYLRFAEKEDMKDLFKWRNEAAARRFSFKTSKVKLKDHIKWFNESLSSPKRNIFIALNKKGEKIGQVRFDRHGKSADISIAIAKRHRGKGYGFSTLKKGCENYFRNFDVSIIKAKIKKENEVSIMAFQKAGFKKFSEKGDYVELRISKDEIWH